jgi:hypothetical protein
MRIIFNIFLTFLFGCDQMESDKSNGAGNSTAENIRKELLSLEQKWLEAEFALDTSYISTLLDPSFIGISADRISGKQEELKGMYDNISAMRTDSIFLDSLKLEEAVVKVYDNSAVVTFVVHTYKKDKGRSTEKRTRFYDVWLNRNGKWKAVSSQGTVVAQ